MNSAHFEHPSNKEIVYFPTDRAFSKVLNLFATIYFLYFRWLQLLLCNWTFGAPASRHVTPATTTSKSSPVVQLSRSQRGGGAPTFYSSSTPIELRSSRTKVNWLARSSSGLFSPPATSMRPRLFRPWQPEWQTGERKDSEKESIMQERKLLSW